ncbi:MAG: Ig-like domain-containing protein [Treponema sp.]|nr:Ig-like domain-containing protein [Treponema sp.]
MKRFLSALLFSAFVLCGTFFVSCDFGGGGSGYQEKTINSNSSQTASSISLFASATDINVAETEAAVCVNFKPANAKVSIWMDTDVVSFKDEPTAVGDSWIVKIKPNRIGTFVVNAQSGSEKKSLAIKVSAPASNIQVTGYASPIDKDKTVKLTAVTTPIVSTSTIKWASSDTNVATVDQSGLVTAKGAGEARITATAVNNDVGRTAPVTGYIDVTVKGFYLNDTIFVLCQKDLDDDVEAKTSGITGGTVAWTSSNTSLFTVAADSSDSKKAKLTYQNGANGLGEVTATLTAGGETYTAKATVIVVPYTMLALGDSIAAGYAPKPMGGDAKDDDMKEQDMLDAYEKYLNRRKGGTAPDYVNEFCYSAKLRDSLAESENIKLLGYANTGDQTKDLIAKLDPNYSDGTIATKKGEILEAVDQADYITLCIGANDILQRATGWNILARDLDWFRATFTQDMATFKTNFDTILEKIFDAGPDTKVYVMSVYSPYHLFNQTNIPASQFGPPWGDFAKKIIAVNGIAEEFLAQLNAYIKSKADNSKVYYVDVADVINKVTDVAEHSKLINADPSKFNLTALISKGGSVVPIWFDPHPRKAGAVKIADIYKPVVQQSQP